MSPYRGREPEKQEEELPQLAETPRQRAVASTVWLTVVIAISVVVGVDDPGFGIMMFAMQSAGLAYYLLHQRLDQWTRDRTARKVAEALVAMDLDDAPHVRVASVDEEEGAAASIDLQESAVVRVQK
jgi:hypothetical protein